MDFTIKQEKQNFTIEYSGQPGLPGSKGDSAYQVWLSAGNTGTIQDFLDSLKGQDGQSSSIEVGTTTTLNPGENANIINTGTELNPVFDFYIPRGDKGEKGEDGSSSNLENIGDGAGIWKETVGSIASLKSLLSVSFITVNENEDGLTIDFGIDDRAFNTAVQGNLEGINEQLSQIETNLDGVSSDITNIFTILDSVDTDITNIGTRLNSIDSSITSINGQISSLNTQVGSNTTAITSINTQIGSINTQITGINSAISSLQTRMTTAETNITNNTTAIGTNTSDITSLKTRMTSAEGKVLPSGGTTGQVLQKNSSTNYDVVWSTPSSSVSEGSGSGGTNASNVYSKNGLAVNTTGTRNNAFGYNSLLANTTGNDNNAFGYSSLSSLISGNYNTAFGSYALQNNTASFNTAVGYQALKANTSGNHNTAVGYNSSYQTTTGTDNTTIGYNNNIANTTGGFNTIIGTGNNNVNTNGFLNVIIGNNNVTTLNDTASNKPQIAVGTDNLKNLIGGSVGAEYNIAIGWSCLGQNTYGRNNIAIGQNAMYNNSSGEESIAIGKYTFLTGGSDNTGVGFNSGSNGTYTNSSGFGAYTLQTNQTVSNVTAIGYQADVTGSNQVQLGNSSTSTYAFGAVQNRSDMRDKANIKDNPLGRDFINGLEAKQWQWNYRSEYIQFVKNDDGTITVVQLENDGSKTRTRFHNGFIAQDVLALMQRLGVDFAGLQHHEVDGGQDVYTLGYEEFIAPIVNTIQEQDKMIVSQEARITSLESTVADLLTRLTALENK